jgi:hypothetical protein
MMTPALNTNATYPTPGPLTLDPKHYTPQNLSSTDAALYFLGGEPFQDLGLMLEDWMAAKQSANAKVRTGQNKPGSEWMQLAMHIPSAGPVSKVCLELYCRT